jgi:DNA polymerase
VKELFLDLETFNTVPITHGTYRYAETAEILLVAFAKDNEDAQVWDMTTGDHALSGLQEMIDEADCVILHNSNFDRTVLSAHGVNLPLDKIYDTMAQALAHSLPASLSDLCEVLGLAPDKSKDKDGKKLINLFSKERPKKHKLRRATRDTHPEEWGRFIEYARMDVVATRYVLRRLPTWNYSGGERSLWILDQRINDRGITVDVGLARSAVRAFQRSAGNLAARSRDLTNGAVASLTQRNKFLQHLSDEYNFETADLTKDTVSALLKADLDPNVRELLEIRQQASATSPAKYGRLLQGVSSDGRLRGTLQFCGASRTGRWGGRLFQPQNLPRSSFKADVVEMGIAALKADAEDLLFDNVSDLCASAVRGTLVSAEGKKLVICDLSNIEGRMLAWLAGEEWKVQAFKEFDRGIGHDIYVLAYAKSFKVDADVVEADKKKGGNMRQIGKVQELALGYQGSVGAFLKMGAIYGISLPEEEVIEIVKAWRREHKAIVSLWYDMDRACKEAIWSPGDSFRVRDLIITMADNDMRIRLPSGRYLCYPDARVADGQIEYEGTNQYTRKWETLRTYGGKLVENVTQAAARDVLAYGMMAAEAAGYEVCLHVHDELITETPDDPRWSVNDLAKIMSTNPDWALGLPLAAAGFEAHRYRKD